MLQFRISPQASLKSRHEIFRESNLAPTCPKVSLNSSSLIEGGHLQDHVRVIPVRSSRLSTTTCLNGAMAVQMWHPSPELPSLVRVRAVAQFLTSKTAREGETTQPEQPPGSCQWCWEKCSASSQWTCNVCGTKGLQTVLLQLWPSANALRSRVRGKRPREADSQLHDGQCSSRRSHSSRPFGSCNPTPL